MKILNSFNGIIHIEGLWSPIGAKKVTMLTITARYAVDVVDVVDAIVTPSGASLLYIHQPSIPFVCSELGGHIDSLLLSKPDRETTSHFMMAREVHSANTDVGRKGRKRPSILRSIASRNSDYTRLHSVLVEIERYTDRTHIIIHRNHRTYSLRYP